jgi:hypothetical protein
MAIAPTRFSRVSVGWVTSTLSLADQDAADTGANFSANGPAVFDDAVTITGAATLSSTLTVAGQVTATSGIAVGGGTPITVISTATIDLDLGDIVGHDSSSVTAALAGVAEGDHVLIQPDSTWTGVNYDVALEAHSTSTAGEINIVARNSAVTDSGDLAAVVARVTAIRFSAFV